MAIFIIISLLFTYFALKKSTEAFIVFCGLKMIALPAMCLKYSSPAISLDVFLNFVFISIFYYKGLFKNFKRNFKKFPLHWYYVFAILSLLCSSIFSIIPFTSLITSLIFYLISDFLIPIMFFILYNRYQNIIYLYLKWSMIIFSITAIYGIVEFLIGQNIILDYIINNVPEDQLLGKLYLGGERLGLRRINSLYVSPNNIIYGAFIASLANAYNLSHHGKKLKYVTIFTFLALFVVILANSRTVLISSLIILFPVFVLSKQSIKYVTISVLILFIAAPFLLQYIANITSVFASSHSSQAIEGSSFDMRLEQLAASYLLFIKSPIFGNGFQSVNYFLSDEGGMAYVLRGAESIWFVLLIERGILGLIAYLSMFAIMAKRYKIFKDSIFLFYVIGYLVSNTMSSMPGFSMSFLYITTFILDKILNNNKNVKNRLNYNS